MTESTLPGTTVGHYLVRDVLGRGGMGVVYRALDTRLDREVAIKTAPPGSAADPQLQRFLTEEMRHASRVRHSFIANVYDVVDTDDGPFCVMELVRGTTLEQRIARGPLDEESCRRYLSEIVEALLAIHDSGIVHRDLNPKNVMIAEDGHVRVIDFGIASRNRDGETGMPGCRETQTAAGSMRGTIPYMAPEQFRGEAVDPRSDLFSLGILLCRMITGVHPFERDDWTRTMLAICQEEPYASDPDARAKLDGSELGHLARKLLEKAPENRQQSAREVLDSLRPRFTRDFYARRRSTSPSPVPFATLIVGLLLMLVVGGLGGRLHSGALYRADGSGAGAVHSLGVLPLTRVGVGTEDPDARRLTRLIAGSLGSTVLVEESLSVPDRLLSGELYRTERGEFLVSLELVQADSSPRRFFAARADSIPELALEAVARIRSETASP